MKLCPEMTAQVRQQLRSRTTDNGETNDDAALYATELLDLAERLTEAADSVMKHLETHGAPIVPHLMDTDDNAGQRLREALADAKAAGLVPKKVVADPDLMRAFQRKLAVMNDMTRRVTAGELPWSAHLKAVAEYEAVRDALLATAEPEN